MIGDFHFLRPLWLLALIAAALLAWSGLRRHDLQRRWSAIVAPHLLAHLVVAPRRRWRLRPVHLTVATIALGAMALAGPTWDRERAPFVEDEAPLAVLVDLSATMDTADVAPSRLERAKLKIRDLLALRGGARTAIFAYAGSAHMVLPLTDDASLLETYVDALATRLMPVPGKDTNAALRLGAGYLGEEAVPGTILFVTDGVEPAAFHALNGRSGRDEIMILGVGGSSPAALDGFRELRDRSGIRLATVTLDSDEDVRWIQRRTQTHLQEMQAEEQSRWADRGWWLTVPLALLAASWFRRGWAMHWAVLLLMTAPLGSAGHAEAADWKDAFASADQQGRRAFEAEDFAAAGRLFADPAWRGAALYRGGDFAGAVEAFTGIDTAEAHYDRANALAHLGKLAPAAEAYGDALERRPDWPEARANLEIVTTLIAAEAKGKDADAADPDEPPDASQFDDKGEKGKVAKIDAGQQSAEIWMRNIAVTPADLMARKFAIEAGGSR